MKLSDRLRRWNAPNAIHRQLYPAPAIEMTFRRYRQRDRDAVLELHDSNAPGRFPENHRPTFEKHLDSDPHSFFVAESRGGEVVACGGVSSVGDQVNILSYGLVSPKRQGCGIGSALTLARLAFATRVESHHFSLIFAVPKSLGFYRRFGYTECGEWDGEDGKKYPIAVLDYPHEVFGPIGARLEKRGLWIDQSLPLAENEDLEAVIEEDLLGVYGVRVEARRARDESP